MALTEFEDRTNATKEMVILQNMKTQIIGDMRQVSVDRKPKPMRSSDAVLHHESTTATDQTIHVNMLKLELGIKYNTSADRNHDKRAFLLAGRRLREILYMPHSLRIIDSLSEISLECSDMETCNKIDNLIQEIFRYARGEEMI